MAVIGVFILYSLCNQRLKIEYSFRTQFSEHSCYNILNFFQVQSLSYAAEAPNNWVASIFSPSVGSCTGTGTGSGTGSGSGRGTETGAGT